MTTTENRRLTRVELTGTSFWDMALKVGGHLLPFQSADLQIEAEDGIPRLTVSLPVVDGLAVTLDAQLGFADETRAALVAAGWTPPQDQP